MFGPFRRRPTTAGSRSGGRIPVYILEGFLESGKTRLLNAWLPAFSAACTRKGVAPRLLCLQAEDGFSTLSPEAAACLASCREIRNPARCTPAFWEDWADAEAPDAVFIEWNGVWPIEPLLASLPRRRFAVQKLICVQRADLVRGSVLRSGDRLQEWMSRADAVVVTGMAESDPAASEIRDLLRTLGATPGRRQLVFRPFDAPLSPRAVQTLSRGGASLLFRLCMVGYGLWALYLLRALLRLPEAQALRTAVEAGALYFLSLLFQILPFLLIAALLSSLIQLLGGESRLNAWLTRSGPLRYPLAAVAGFVLPVCDCGLVPIVTRLVRQGVPVPLALVFFCSATALNPLVLASTAFAFPGQPKVLFWRVGLAWTAALLACLVYACFPKAVRGRWERSVQGLVCASGYPGRLPRAPFGRRVVAVLRHTGAEFFSLTRYVIIGALLTAAVHTLFPPRSWAGAVAHPLLGLPLLLAACLFLALCASSNAFLARSFAGAFPPGALVLYLCFAPLLDAKNLLLLRSGFGGKGVRAYACLFLGLLILLYGVLVYVLPQAWLPLFALAGGAGGGLYGG